MKFKKNQSLKSFLVFFIFITTIAFSQSEDSKVIIKNDHITKNITASESQSSAINIQLLDKDDNLIASTNEKYPYFEFVLNNKLIKASDPLWVLSSQESREMGNGGTEHTLVFKGEQEPVKGLEVTIYQQIFPNSTAIREKMVLRKSDDTKFTLNKLDNKLHFKFPQYAVKSTSAASSTEIRIATFEKDPVTFHEEGRSKYNHSFYPEINNENLVKGETLNVKGPINIVETGTTNWLTAYEHGSQDDLSGVTYNKEPDHKGIVDGFQGVIGEFDIELTVEQLKFLGISQTKEADVVGVSTDILRGGYLEGEEIINERPYETVWSFSLFYEGDLDKGKSLIRHYLLNQITEHTSSRNPNFYYNTWGMQREENITGNVGIRDVLTVERVLEEIDNASQLGVDLFILDDGWNETQGIWTPNKERFPNGLKPFKERLDELDMKMGVWFSPLGIDSTTTRFKENPEWVVTDSRDKPVLAQWKFPAFDFVSDYYDVFIQEAKDMIDQGVSYFKFDAISTLYSQLPNLHHGSDAYTGEELRARYEYLLPFYITRAMEELTDYKPDLIIEVDLTEGRRVMPGLACLANGKWFFMNNGASGYNDYSDYRAKSMRTPPNAYNGIIPLELFTYANYPQNQDGDQAYNVNSSLISGHGFWGNLNLMTDDERLFVGNQLKKTNRVLPYLVENLAEITGDVGDNPEIYKQINNEESAGQIIVFGRDNTVVPESVDVNEEKFLAVLDQEYSFKDGNISLDLQLADGTSTDQAYILPDSETSGNKVINSTVALNNVVSTTEKLTISTSGAGELVILLNKGFGEQPKITGSNVGEFTAESSGDKTKVTLQIKAAGEVQIMAGS